MKTIIKTTMKGSENLEVSQSVDQVYDSLIDKQGFCLFDRVTSAGKTKMIIKKSVIKIVVERKRKILLKK